MPSNWQLVSKTYDFDRKIWNVDQVMYCFFEINLKCSLLFERFVCSQIVSLSQPKFLRWRCEHGNAMWPVFVNCGMLSESTLCYLTFLFIWRAVVEPVPISLDSHTQQQISWSSRFPSAWTPTPFSFNSGLSTIIYESQSTNSCWRNYSSRRLLQNQIQHWKIDKTQQFNINERKWKRIYQYSL